MIPLALMKEGKKGTVLDVSGGHAYRNLQEMGIVKGKEIRVLRNGGGAMLIAINGARFVIGRGLAMKVIVDAEQKN